MVDIVDSRIKKIYKCYKELIGQPIKMDLFEDRILFQKVIYLLNEAGIKFDYHFTWYIRGPYATSLASDGYLLSENLKNIEESEIHLNQKDIDKIANIKREFPELSDLTNAELYSAIIYFMKRGYNDKELVSVVLKFKPWYSEKRISEAISKIKNSHLFSEMS